MAITQGPVSAGVKSVQRGQVYATGGTAGTAPEVRYIDVTITAVNTAKARVNVVGVVAARSLQGDADQIAQKGDIAYNTLNEYGIVFGYLLNSTTIRIYGGMTGTTWRWSGRWEVIEDF